jgi:hypothetical protein
MAFMWIRQVLFVLIQMPCEKLGGLRLWANLADCSVGKRICGGKAQSRFYFSEGTKNKLPLCGGVKGKKALRLERFLRITMCFIWCRTRISSPLWGPRTWRLISAHPQKACRRNKNAPADRDELSSST